MLFAPISHDRNLKTDHPELKEVSEFDNLSNKEMLFVWYFANVTSPYAKIRSPREKALQSLKKVWGDSMPQKLKDEMLSGQFSAKMRDAIEKMGSYAPELRARAKSMVEGIFDTYETILSERYQDFEGENATKNRQEYVDISGKIIKAMPDLVKQIETGYGVKTGISDSSQVGGNIMDDIRTNT